MTSSCCPSCLSPQPTLLAVLSKDARVNYYRCSNCGHVWTIDRETGNVLHHVTALTAR